MSGRDADRGRLRAVLGRFVTDPAELDAVFGGAPFLETVSIDSITLVHLIVSLEKEYAVRFDFEAMDRSFADVDSLLAFVSSRPGSGPR